MPDLTKQFDKAMLDIYHRAQSEAGYHAPKFFEMLRRGRGVATAKTLINSAAPSLGFTHLYERTHLDLTVEAMVIENPKWHELFTQDELRKAQVRLEKFGYSPGAVAVLTFKSVETCVEIGGTQSWVLNREHALRCRYVVLCRNAEHVDVEGSEAHRSAFMIGHISDVVPSNEGEPDRWNILFDHYAVIDVPDVWSGRNPVAYSTLKDLHINIEDASFQSVTAKPESKAVSGYWAFVCNPQKWAIDRFLTRGITEDTWGVRKSDAHLFAPGQLAVVRVGNDNRTRAQLQGAAPLKAGIYAICQVVSRAQPGTGANDDFWDAGEAREPGWPTVKIRYLKSFLGNPLTIEQMHIIAPALSPLMLNGFQASSFPLSERDFATIFDLMELDADDLPIEDNASDPSVIAALAKEYAQAAPIMIERLSRQIERGRVGLEAKKANGFRCQICEKLGRPSLGFQKRDGTPYVEAHHVIHVSTRGEGVLAPSNVITVCPNHHREFHYGPVEVTDLGSSFRFTVAEGTIVIPKLGVTATGPIN